jgi:hypothetical protein
MMGRMTINYYDAGRKKGLVLSAGRDRLNIRFLNEPEKFLVFSRASPAASPDLAMKPTRRQHWNSILTSV